MHFFCAFVYPALWRASYAPHLLTVSCLFFGALWYYYIFILFHLSNLFYSGLLSGLALITLLLLVYLSLHDKYQPCSPKNGLLLTVVFGPSYGYSIVLQHDYTKRCRAPFSDLGDPKKKLLCVNTLTR